MALSGVRSSWLKPDDMAALGLARRFRDLLGLLQLGVGALVRLDLVHQQIGLPARLLLGDAAAVLRQHEQPGGDAGDDGENEEHASTASICRTALGASESSDTWK